MLLLQFTVEVIVVFVTRYSSVYVKQIYLHRYVEKHCHERIILGLGTLGADQLKYSNVYDFHMLFQMHTKGI